MGATTQRDTFWNKVYDMAHADPDVMVVSADMGAPSLDRFRKNLANQFINAGIAEQNAILISAGLAFEGKKVFTYAIAPFITYRCFEQIKLYLCAMNLPVTVVGVGAGFSYDDSGPTHHTVEDVTLMRMLPNMEVNTISDNAMAAGIAERSAALTHPNYVRLDRKTLPPLYGQDEDFSLGVSQIQAGSDLTIVAMGNMVHRAKEVAVRLAEQNVSAAVLDVYTLPIPTAPFQSALSTATHIVTMEEHTLPGGLGSAVLETLNALNMQIPVQRFGLDLSTGYHYGYGGRERIQDAYRLDSQTISRLILERKG